MSVLPFGRRVIAPGQPAPVDEIVDDAAPAAARPDKFDRAVFAVPTGIRVAAAAAADPSKMTVTEKGHAQLGELKEMLKQAKALEAELVQAITDDNKTGYRAAVAKIKPTLSGGIIRAIEGVLVKAAEFNKNASALSVALKDEIAEIYRALQIYRQLFDELKSSDNYADYEMASAGKTSAIAQGQLRKAKPIFEEIKALGERLIGLAEAPAPGQWERNEAVYDAMEAGLDDLTKLRERAEKELEPQSRTSFNKQNEAFSKLEAVLQERMLELEFYRDWESAPDQLSAPVATTLSKVGASDPEAAAWVKEQAKEQYIAAGREAIASAKQVAKPSLLVGRVAAHPATGVAGFVAANYFDSRLIVWPAKASVYAAVAKATLDEALETEEKYGCLKWGWKRIPPRNPAAAVAAGSAAALTGAAALYVGVPVVGTLLGASIVATIAARAAGETISRFIPGAPDDAAPAAAAPAVAAALPAEPRLRRVRALAGAVANGIKTPFRALGRSAYRVAMNPFTHGALALGAHMYARPDERANEYVDTAARVAVYSTLAQVGHSVYQRMAQPAAAAAPAAVAVA
ncbi:MAG TPA: hypothetical protein VLF94_07675, partial [Chlamydiales bacterium]|nr:hypothetical protein [Chlamydiales bacterium]